MAFPSIATGVYRFPLAEAAPIAIRTVVEQLPSHLQLRRVKFVLFDEVTHHAYASALDQIPVEFRYSQ